MVVVAPDRAHSGCGHRVTSDDPISVEERSPGRWSISGTPADCVRVGLWSIAPDADWILSGINLGANLGVDVFMSGTVAAVREGALLGCRGIAFSHYRRPQRPVRLGPGPLASRATCWGTCSIAGRHRSTSGMSTFQTLKMITRHRSSLNALWPPSRCCWSTGNTSPDGSTAAIITLVPDLPAMTSMCVFPAMCQ